jgi:hypothetical protein
MTIMENCDHRVLGGFQCFDAITNQSIVDPLKISNTQLSLRANRSGVYAIWDAPNLRQYTAFDPPTPWPNPETPAPEITISDPSLRYLPRRATLQVPQALPTTSPPPTTPPSFTATVGTAITYGPQPITLYRSPAAQVAPNWAVVRASVASNANPPAPLPWAVLRVMSGATIMATGVADANGEALLAVPGLGLQLSSTSGGPVTETLTTATVQVWFDFTVPPPPVSNPDDILLNLTTKTFSTASASVQFGPGQTVLVPLTVSPLPVPST